MELHNLKPIAGSNKSNTRLARGQGSGKGGTATRGTKGNQSRAGHKNKRKFEGGQTPIQMRLPKRGFNNHQRYQSYNASEYVAVNVDMLQYFAEQLQTTVLDPAALYQAGVIKNGQHYKVLADGEITTSLEVAAYRFSEKAKQEIEAAGGKAYYYFKLSQIQGIVHKYHLKFVNPKTIATYFDYVKETDNIWVEAEGDLTLTFDLHVHKISAQAQAQVEGKGGKVTIL
jgi:large subunit ribosomal protein L15